MNPFISMSLIISIYWTQIKNRTYSDWNKKNKSKDDKDYFNFLKYIEKQKIPSTEIIFQFPIYLGEKNLARHIQFYELFKKVQNLSGHIADVGTWKGSSMIFMSKLVKILENNSGTKVYGFDWFCLLYTSPSPRDTG